jgi:RNA polymerase sigma-70 factor, ECF subfamily
VVDVSADAVVHDRRGSIASFENFFVASWSPLFRYCLGLVRDRDEAEDVAAEAFRRAFAAWKDGRGPTSESLPWLFLVARRIVIDQARRRRLVAWLRLDHVGDASGDEDPIGRSDVWIWFKQVCDLLPTREREALLLRHEFGFPDETIGQLMGMSQASVRTAVSRGLARLRSHPEVLR